MFLGVDNCITRYPLFFVHGMGFRDDSPSYSYKGKYRAIFYLEEKNIYIIALDKREEVYKKWR